MRSVECRCGHDPTSHFLETITNGGSPMPAFRNGEVVRHALVQVRMACLCRGCDCGTYKLREDLRAS